MNFYTDKTAAGASPDVANHPLMIYGVEAFGHKLVTCGPHTGHTYRDIAFCKDSETAAFIATVLLTERERRS